MRVGIRNRISLFLTKIAKFTNHAVVAGVILLLITQLFSKNNKTEVSGSGKMSYNGIYKGKAKNLNTSTDGEAILVIKEWDVETKKVKANISWLGKLSGTSELLGHCKQNTAILSGEINSDFGMHQVKLDLVIENNRLLGNYIVSQKSGSTDTQKGLLTLDKSK